MERAVGGVCSGMIIVIFVLNSSIFCLGSVFFFSSLSLSSPLAYHLPLWYFEEIFIFSSVNTFSFDSASLLDPSARSFQICTTFSSIDDAQGWMEGLILIIKWAPLSKILFYSLFVFLWPRWKVLYLQSISRNRVISFLVVMVWPMPMNTTWVAPSESIRCTKIPLQLPPFSLFAIISWVVHLSLLSSLKWPGWHFNEFSHPLLSCRRSRNTNRQIQFRANLSFFFLFFDLKSVMELMVVSYSLHDECRNFPGAIVREISACGGTLFTCSTRIKHPECPTWHQIMWCGSIAPLSYSSFAFTTVLCCLSRSKTALSVGLLFNI